MADNNYDAIMRRLNGDFRTLAEIVGVEAALMVSAKFGGQYISIPKLDELRREVRDTSIRDIYDKSRNKTRVVRTLARDHNLTVRQIYNILGKQPLDECELVLPLFFEDPFLK